MSSSLSLVLEHLTANQQQSIVDDIVNHLKEIQENDSENTYIDTLCALLGQSPQLEVKLQDFAFDYAVGVLKFEDPSLHFGSILKLSLKIKQLSTKLMAYVVEKLKSYLTTYPRHFDDKFVKSLNLDFGRGNNYDLSSAFILNLLKFTDWFLINNESFSEKYYDSTLDQLCFLYLTNEESDISKTSSKVLKWRMPSVCQTDESSSFLWKIIFLLEESGDKTEISYGYVLWLRYFNFFKPSKLKTSMKFQLVLSNDKYWLFLRDGLISLTHEHKKFALTLIQLSIQSLATDLSLPIIKWECDKETEYVESWKRFCTLYEILGIDAAMNQVQAAANDLLKVFAPDSYIPVPFSLTILSVGFKASMDRIKSFALNLTFSLPKESLSLFKNDFKFISHVFLPFTMKSFHFTVFKTMNGDYQCQFGDKIAEFISNCVESLNNPADITKLVGLIFDIISENRLTFGIARIYIVWGVLNGLQKKENQVLKSPILPSLLPLFETVAEGDISKTTLQTIHLRILLHIDAGSINLRSYLRAIVYFIQNNGYSLYAENEEFFLDYFSANFEKNEFMGLLTNNTQLLSPEEFVVVSSYLLSKKTDVPMITPLLLSHPQNPKIVIQMAVCGLDFHSIWKDPLIVSCIERFVEEMAAGSKKFDISIYSDCKALFKNSSLFASQFWESMPLNALFSEVSKSLIKVDNMEEAYYLIAQFKFITVCFGECIYNENFAISFDSLVILLKNALKKVPRGSDPRFYKAKDEVISFILQNITSLFKISVFDENFKNGVLSLANDVISMSEYHSHLSNVKMITAFLDSYDERKLLTSSEASSIASSLSLIWDDLVKDRLVLNQRDLHQAFIRLALHKKLLVCSIDQKDLAKSLLTILEQVIANSSSRKGLLPCMFKAVSEYQVNEKENFEKTLWLAQLLVKGVFLFQSELNIFQLDCIIAQNFDKYLNISGEPLYTTVYGDPEVSYRANIFAIAASLQTEIFASEVWRFIFENDDMFHLIRPKKRTGHEEQWKRIQLLSLLTTTHGVLNSSKLLPYMRNQLLPRLFKEASPLCRAYIEWLLCLTIIRVPAFKGDVFAIMKEGFEAQQPLVVVSFERISMLISMQLPKEEETKFLTQFVADVIIPTSSSNRALNRHFSSSMACLIYDQIVSRELDFPLLLKESLSKIHEIAHKAEGYGSYRSGDAILWDITTDCNLVSITGGLLLKVSDRAIDAIYQADYQNYLTEKQKSILRLPIGHDEKELWIACDRKEQVKLESFYADAYNENEESSLLQTKSGAWSTVMELDENVRAAAQIKRSPLIVVSSLVDKAPNLGGICRLCDCLGAGWMTVDDLSVKNNSEFKSVAVTADRWMPLIEVKIQDITDFMRLKKKEGYTLIGLEQTDKSVELNGDLKFPEKSLILLGKEREGIPGDLLAELDLCVIIKQVGIVRSMNIQTATAVIVHAYSSQHC
ncbi:Putative trna ribose methyltransferase [Pichia membranifaciens]|uniref:Putative trna ribose methyltransferase n=1 Tax=Pichia membranifaciens TaxID=4926 RepID=A0A1Q2YAP7_9ASCO|nr:Putative trna ribose methyltransferase [Pichia membranifaciens]